MEKISYSAHISNKKSAITSKAKLAGVAKHNLRKYHSSDYSQEEVVLLYGTDNLMKDVKRVYREEFDEALKEYNAKQTREDRKIDDYFSHVVEKQQDMAVEIIFQIGDKEFWETHQFERENINSVYDLILWYLGQYMPDFVVANAVVHYDEASPHMHVVGVPVGRGFKRGLATKVSKRSVFTQETLSKVLQGEIREIAESCVMKYLNMEFKEKKKGRNHDLSVMEYKVKQETVKKENLEFDNSVLKGEREEIKDDIKMLKSDREELEKRNREAMCESISFIQEKKELEQELKKTEENLQEVRAIASLGDEEIDSLRYMATRGPEELSGLMSAKTYREKIVEPFLNKIWGLVNTIIARAKSCFAELKKVQREMATVKEENENLKWEYRELKGKLEYQKELCEELDRENDELRDDSRKLDYFKEYLPRETYEQIVDIAERQHEREK